MTDIVVRKRAGYTILWHDLLEPGILSARAWGLYTYLITRPDGWKPQVRDLQSWFTEGRDAIRAGLNELVDNGYMDKVEVLDGGLKRTRYVLDADRQHRRRSAPETENPDAGNPDADFQAHKKNEVRSNEVRKRESTYVLSRSDTRSPRGRSDSRRPASNRASARKRESADADLDPTKAPDVVDEASDPEPYNRRADSSMSLVAYFWDRLKNDGVGARAIMTIPDPVNRRKLAATFTRWKKAGTTADDIRAMIDAYQPDTVMLSRRIPPWLDFLARRAQLAGTRADDQILNDTASQKFLDYWGITEADLAPLPEH